MKKSILAVIIGTAGVLAATAAISVVAISANNNKNNDTTEASGAEISEISSAIELALPEDKEAIRSEIISEYSEKQDKLRQQMIADGKDARNAAFDADVQMEVEQANEAADILKKHNRLDNNFTFEGINDNLVCLKAACDLLNSSENITVRDRVVVEMFLERGYRALEWHEGTEDLAKEIANTISLPY